MKSDISKKIAALKKELGKSKLVAVSKYSSPEDVESAYLANQFDFGENRVQDLEVKARFFCDKNYSKVRWHFIGHLQTNKVKDLIGIPNLWAIHSVDSIRLLEELFKREDEFKGNELKLFFQVNTSHEAQKSGFESAEELELALSQLLTRSHSKFKAYGLMTMGTLRTTDFESEAQRCFRDLKLIKERLELKFKLKEPLKLSMGMSADYKLALAEGADFIRIGSAIFK